MSTLEAGWRGGSNTRVGGGGKDYRTKPGGHCLTIAEISQYQGERNISRHFFLSHTFGKRLSF